jgi:hypothetical protein
MNVNGSSGKRESAKRCIALAATERARLTVAMI